jgi:general secretion pathway protein L
VILLDGIAGQDFIRRMQDHFIDPAKACLVTRFGGVAQSNGKLSLRRTGASFQAQQSEALVELSSPEHDISLLKAFVHRCYGDNKPRIQVEIDPELLLIREVRLPLAAKRNLREVIGYEMDRLSPFEADEVYYHFTPGIQNGSGEWLVGQLIVAQKKRLDPWYQLLAQLGITIEKVTLLDDGVSLTLKPRQHGRTQSRNRSSKLLWTLSAMLLAVAMVSAVWQQRQIVVDLQHKMQVARQSATQSMRLEEQLSQRREAVGMVLAQREDYLTMSDLLLELTRLIPTTSWLRRVKLTSKELILTGLSDQASELIAILERSPLFESVRFKSPVVRDRRSGKESFDLTLKLTQEGEK